MARDEGNHPAHVHIKKGKDGIASYLVDYATRSFTLRSGNILKSNERIRVESWLQKNFLPVIYKMHFDLDYNERSGENINFLTPFPDESAPEY